MQEESMFLLTVNWKQQKKHNVGKDALDKSILSIMLLHCLHVSFRMQGKSNGLLILNKKKNIIKPLPGVNGVYHCK